MHVFDLSSFFLAIVLASAAFVPGHPRASCNASRLLWYTDFNEARAAAEATGRPILSVRLRGRLDNESLYADDEVSQYLRDNYVLHWERVHPTSRTSGSTHYIFDAKGNIVQRLPGVMRASAFLRELQHASWKARHTQLA